MESAPLYEKLIYRNEDKFYELRLVVNEFREKHYVHIRKYFLSFDEGYIPSREGISMEASFENIFSLLDGLMDICSREESLELIEKYFGDKILNLKSTNN